MKESTDEKGEDLRKFFQNEDENLPKDTVEDEIEEEDSADIEDLNVEAYIRYFDLQNLSFLNLLLRDIVLSGEGQNDCVLYTDIGYQAVVDIANDSPSIMTTDFLSKWVLNYMFILIFLTFNSENEELH